MGENRSEADARHSTCVECGETGADETIIDADGEAHRFHRSCKIGIRRWLQGWNADGSHCLGDVEKHRRIELDFDAAIIEDKRHA